MAIVYFCKNASFDMDGREYQLNQEIAIGVWQVQEVRTGRIHEFNIQELQQRYADGKLVFFEDTNKSLNRDTALTNLPNDINRQLEGKAWDNAKIKRAYAKAIEHLPSTEGIVKQTIEEIWQKIKQPEKAPHWVSVCAWKKKYIAHGKDTFALGEQHQRKGNRTPRYPNEVIEIAEDCIERIYMRRERGTVEETAEEVVVMIERENKHRPMSLQLPRPTRRLIERLINLIPAFDRDAARYGRIAANRKYRSKLKHLVRPLQNHPN